MLRMRVGRDEIRFEETQREAAEALAQLLPQVRARGQEIVGVAGRPLRVVVSSRPPHVREYYPFKVVPILAGLVVGLVGWVFQEELSRLLLTLCYLCGGLSGGILGGQLIVRHLLTRRLRAMWPNLGGACFDYDRHLPPVLILQWPRPTPLPITLTLVFRPEPEGALLHLLAHEYAHVLLRARYRKTRLPVWWDEGFAFWFTEQVTGEPFWRPESREQLATPEPKGNARRLLGKDDYIRLCARYYWEARTLAEEGRLAEVLAAPWRRIDSFRPKAALADQAAPRR